MGELTDILKKKREQGKSPAYSTGAGSGSNELTAVLKAKKERDSEMQQYAKEYAENQRKERAKKLNESLGIGGIYTPVTGWSGSKGMTTRQPTEKKKTYINSRNPGDYMKLQEQEQEKQKLKQMRAQQERAIKRQGFQSGDGFVSYGQIGSQADYEQQVQAGRQAVNALEGRNSNPFNFLDKDYRDYYSTNPNMSYMDGNERGIYQYLTGKYGMKAGADYVESMSPKLNERAARATTKDIVKASAEDSSKYLGDYVQATYRGYAAAPGILAKQAYNNLLKGGEPLNPNDPMFLAEIEKDAMRQGFKENQKLQRILPNDSVRGFAVDTGLSMGENVLRLPAGVYGLGLAATGAGTSGMRDALGRGASGEQAIGLGISNAAAEAFFEKFSLEGLGKLKTAPATGVKSFFKNLAKQGAVEGSEEVFTEIANTISDNAIMGDLSQYNQDYQRYRAMGAGEEEAKGLAFRSFLSRVGMAGLGGAVSGGIMGAGAQGLGLAGQELYYTDTGRSINPDYRDYASGIDTDRNSYQNPQTHQEATELQRIAQEYADRQLQGKGISNREKGRFDARMDEWASSMASQQVQENMPAQQPVAAEKLPSVQNAEEYVPEAENRQETGIWKPEEQRSEAWDVGQQGTDPAPGIKLGKRSAALQQEDAAQIRGQMEGEQLEYMERGKEAVEKQYDGSLPLDVYLPAFRQFYQAGRQNREFGSVNTATSRMLDQQVATAAYKAGMQDQNTYMKNAETVLDTVGKKTGLRFVLSDSIQYQGRNVKAEGMYQARKGVITIARDADNILSTTSHELTHFIKDYAAEEYGAYRDTVMGYFSKSTDVDLDSMVEEYRTRYGNLSDDEITDEIVADATERFLNDENFMSEIAAKKPGLAQKIIDFFTDMVDSIRQLIRQQDPQSTPSKALQQNMEVAQRAREQWAGALEKAGTVMRETNDMLDSGRMERAAASTDDSARYKLNEFGLDEYTAKEKEWWKDNERIILCNSKEDIIDFCKQHLHKKPFTRLYLGKISDQLAERIYNDTEVELEGYSVVLTSDFENSHTDEAKERGRGQIPVTPEMLADLPEIIHSYDRVSVGTETRGKKPALKFEKDINGRRVAIEYVSDKRKMLTLQTMYAWGQKNRNVPTAPDVLAPAQTSETRSGIVPIDRNVTTVSDAKAPSETSETSGSMVPTDSSLQDSGGNVNINKFQLKDVAEGYESAILELVNENRELQEANELLQRQFELTSKDELRMQDIKKVVKDILERYHSDYSAETLERNISKVFEYIRSSDQVDGKEVSTILSSIARSVLKQSRQQDTAMSETYRDLRKQIRNTKITISEQDKSELASAGGYSAFRKRNFGRMSLGNDGISVDSLYQELSDQHPELFDRNVTHPADQLMAIADVLDQTDPQVANPYHANMEEMSYILGQEIMDSYYQVRNPKPTYADRKEAEIQRVRRDYTKRMTNYKENIRSQYDQKLNDVKRQNLRQISELTEKYNASQGEQKEYYRQKIKDLRNTKNQALAAMQQKNRDQAWQRRDRKRAQDAKKIILKDAKALQTWLLKPNDIKHIPQELRATVAEFLRNIDFSSNEENNNGIPTQRTNDWENLKKSLDRIINSEGMVQGDDGKITYMDIDPDLAARIDGIAKKIEGIDKLDNLDGYNMEEVKKIVASMKKALTETNSLKSNKRYGEVSLLADKVFSDLSERKTKLELAGLAMYPEKLLNYDMLDAQTMFEQFGPGAKTLYDALRDGLDKKTIKVKAGQDYMEDLKREQGVTSKNIREWSGTGAKSTRFQVSGGVIDLTTGQIMALYELNKRKQARGHIYDRNGGIKQAPRKVRTKIENGKPVLSHIEKGTRPVRVTEEDVQRITATLTEEQKAIADGIQRFIGNEVAEWGNEVTMSLYGYKKFTAGEYFPIVTDKNYIPTKEGDIVNQTSTIKNLGITKSTVEHANNPIIVEDIFDVFTRQVDQMSSYNAYVIPLSDMQKLYNYRDMRSGLGSIKQEIERTFGKSGNKYIHQLLVDINGSIQTEKTIGDKMISNMKAASVAGNLRVAIQQPTAYLRAMMEINPKYLGQGALTISRKDQWAMICKYAPIAQWKDWGFYRMDTSRQIKDILLGTDNTKQRVVDKTMWFAEMGDKIAWNRLWRACEAECRDLHPELEQGSETYYRQIGKRFSEIIDKTQVVDSVLHRTQIMRSQDGLTKMATSFMAEPLKSYDILYRAAMDIRLKKPGSKKHAIRAAAVYVLTNFMTAIAASVLDATRDNDRDKSWPEKYKQAVSENIMDSIIIFNNIPFVKDIVSTKQGYTPIRTDVSAWQDLVYAWNRIVKLRKGESKDTPQYVAYYSVRMTSKLLGVPINSICRDIEAIIDTAMNKTSGMADYRWLKQHYDIKNKSNLRIYANMILENQEEGNTEVADQIRSDLIEAGIKKKDIDKKINELIKEQLEDDERVSQAAQARIDGDPDLYRSLYDELVEEVGYEKPIQSAITTATNVLREGEVVEEAEAEEETEEDTEDVKEATSIYEYSDAWNALKSGNTKGFQKVADDMYRTKVQNGKTSKEAMKDIRTQVTKKYKPLWQEAKQPEKDKIFNMVKTLRVNGEYLYEGYDFNRYWKNNDEE